MGGWEIFNSYPLSQKINALFRDGRFIVSIRYYSYKVNLYQLGNDFVEVFINHKRAEIVKIEKLDTGHSRMKFYCDQIKISY